MKQYSSNSYIFLINIFHHNQYQKILKSDKTNFRCNSKYCLKIHMQSKRKKSADQISFSIFHDNLSINVLLFTTQSMIQDIQHRFKIKIVTRPSPLFIVQYVHNKQVCVDISPYRIKSLIQSVGKNFHYFLLGTELSSSYLYSEEKISTTNIKHSHKAIHCTDSNHSIWKIYKI